MNDEKSRKELEKYRHLLEGLDNLRQNMYINRSGNKNKDVKPQAAPVTQDTNAKNQTKPVKSFLPEDFEFKPSDYKPTDIKEKINQAKQKLMQAKLDHESTSKNIFVHDKKDNYYPQQDNYYPQQDNYYPQQHLKRPTEKNYLEQTETETFTYIPVKTEPLINIPVKKVTESPVKEENESVNDTPLKTKNEAFMPPRSEPQSFDTSMKTNNEIKASYVRTNLEPAPLVFNRPASSFDRSSTYTSDVVPKYTYIPISKNYFASPYRDPKDQIGTVERYNTPSYAKKYFEKRNQKSMGCLYPRFIDVQVTQIK